MQTSSSATRSGQALLRPAVWCAMDGVAEQVSGLVRSDPAAGAQEWCLRVLVVDDEPVNRILACSLLAGWGIQSFEAADGAQAVAIANRQPLDLILMDLQMPVLDGYAATRQIRRIERERSGARVPVLAFTSTEVSQGVLDRSGIDGLLNKPCEPQAMHACVTRWCAVPGRP